MTSLTKEELNNLKKGSETPIYPEDESVIIEADKFIGNLEGNASTASKLEQPSRLTFGGDTSGTVNLYGSDANIVNVHVNRSDEADHAEEAERAKSTARARLADLANIATLAREAELSKRAVISQEATHAQSADTATQADSATVANRAYAADTATQATKATNATHATNADHATRATTAEDSAHSALAEVANIAKALDFTIVKVVTAYPETMDADALYVLVDSNNKIIGIDTKNKIPVDFDIMTVDVLPSISESTVMKDGKLYAVPSAEGSGTKLDPRLASIVFKRNVEGVDVYFQVSGGGGSVVLPEASTTKKGIVQLSNSISIDDTKAVTPKAINDLKDDTFVTMSTAQYVYATKTDIYNESQRVDNNFVTLSTAQYITNLKTFNSILPQSNLTPTDDKDFTTKKFIDDLFTQIKTETARASVTFGGVNQMNFTEE